MPKPYPKELLDEVVSVALNHEDGVRIGDIAEDVGITESCLGHWMAQARDEGQRPETRSELAELREAKKRIRLPEQENEVLRRAAAYLGQANLPQGARRVHHLPTHSSLGGLAPAEYAERWTINQPALP